MKYRIFTLLGLLALGAGSVLQAQDYDDIYFDASKSTGAVKTKVETPAKTVAVYGEVPDKYKVVAKSNYRVERDEDEYNRRVTYEPEYEVDINGDTIYISNDSIYDDEAFANTRLIERFYNPDIVILSDDDDLVELYYDESPTINLIVGSDWGWNYYYPSYYWGWGYGNYWYDPWYPTWYRPSWYGWYGLYGWSWHGPSLWGWPYRPYWGGPHGWDSWYGWHHGYTDYWTGHKGGYTSDGRRSWRDSGGRVGTAVNRNGRGRTVAANGRNGIAPRSNDTNRGTRVGTSTTGRSGGAVSRNGGNIGTRGGNIGTRGGNIGTRGGSVGTRGGGNIGTRSSGVGTRGTSSVSRPSTGVTRSSSSSYGGGRSYSGGSTSRSSSYGGSSRSGSSYSGSSRSSGSSYGGSRSSGGSYSGGGSHSSGGSYGGGGSHSSGGSSGGGGHRR